MIHGFTHSWIHAFRYPSLLRSANHGARGTEPDTSRCMITDERCKKTAEDFFVNGGVSLLWAPSFYMCQRCSMLNYFLGRYLSISPAPAEGVDSWPLATAVT
jgi:hypothetical protein